MSIPLSKVTVAYQSSNSLEKPKVSQSRDIISYQATFCLNLYQL
jgi:hypothetical protein